MSTIVTTSTTRPVRAGQSTATVPLGTRVQCVAIEPDSLRAAVGMIGTVVSHTSSGTQPEVRFAGPVEGRRDWFVAEYRVLPNPGTRVVVTECLSEAQDVFRQWATGQEVTYVSTGPDGNHLVRFDTVPGDDYPNPASVAHLDFRIGEQAPVSDEVSNPVGPSYEERERTARRLYETLVEAVNDMAEREEWCSSFENWAENLPHDTPFEVRRTQDVDYSVSIDLTYEIDSDDVASWLRRNHGGEHDDVDASDVTVTSSVVVSMTISGGDNPNDVDSYTVESALSDANYSGYSDWSITNYETSY